ncbi:hypothetical protein RchiOBHm_Chr6g0269371 [Rosa chinensis]|uniref:Uncharacterized protein n=1 Tax=Rosa chinensis TaxID=74649 RepID=A0A2P6PQG2_ROSCH|nr:hypothetical protein RchiOBHm_Chr6g0269371 [Rosa chinensis]
MVHNKWSINQPHQHQLIHCLRKKNSLKKAGESCLVPTQKKKTPQLCDQMICSDTEVTWENNRKHNLFDIRTWKAALNQHHHPWRPSTKRNKLKCDDTFYVQRTGGSNFLDNLHSC